MHLHILSFLATSLALLPFVIGASLSYGFDANEDAGGDGGSLAASILQSGTSLASEAILANADPSNVALLQGQTISTPSLTTGSPTRASLGISTSGLLVVLVIGVIIFFAIRK